TLGSNPNYDITPTNGTLTIGQKSATVVANDKSKTYGDDNPVLDATVTGTVNDDELDYTLSTLAEKYSDVDDYAITVTLGSNPNYDITPTNGTLNIGQKSATVVANDKSKYCGTNLIFNGDEFITTGFINDDKVISTTITSDGATALAPASDSPYHIEISEAVGAGLSNYKITYVPGKLTINGLTTIDASASGNPTSINSTAKLSAIIDPAVEGVLIRFYINNSDTAYGEDNTDASGNAEIDFPTGSDAAVYKITAVAGSDCLEPSVAYLPVYDPSAGFVTGGGWIWSPAGAYVADAALEGKANFGFVAKYKKGKTVTNEVEGNTEFQFKAGDLNFKSQLHESGSLVISGGKATYRGHGTINGTGSYKFTLVAFDGNWNNGTTSDRFRIKIWGEQGVVYDNGLGADENSNEASILGGGSIVIHEVKGGGSQKAQQEATVAQTFEPVVEILTSMSVSPNPVSTEALVRFTFNADASAMVEVFDFSNRKVAGLFNGKVTANQVNEVTLNRDGLPGGSYFVKVSASNGQTFTKQIIID
ncbi:MAG: MBG domain-containing protein, partial [Salinimicrobium sediminis]|nr:MBG domain-containing protein [Salinimicrobium sediminis]